VKLLLNIEQLLSEKVSVFEEVIFVKMPEVTAMLLKTCKFFREAHCRANKPYSYIDEAINLFGPSTSSLSTFTCKRLMPWP